MQKILNLRLDTIYFRHYPLVEKSMRSTGLSPLINQVLQILSQAASLQNQVILGAIPVKRDSIAVFLAATVDNLHGVLPTS